MRSFSLPALPVVTLALMLIVVQPLPVMAEGGADQYGAEEDHDAVMARVAAENEAENRKHQNADYFDKQKISNNDKQAIQTLKQHNADQNQQQTQQEYNRVHGGSGQEDASGQMQQTDQQLSLMVDNNGDYHCVGDKSACKQEIRQIEETCAGPDADVARRCKVNYSDDRVQSVSYKYGLGLNVKDNVAKEAGNSADYEKYKDANNKAETDNVSKAKSMYDAQVAVETMSRVDSQAAYSADKARRDDAMDKASKAYEDAASRAERAQRNKKEAEKQWSEAIAVDDATTGRYKTAEMAKWDKEYEDAVAAMTAAETEMDKLSQEMTEAEVDAVFGVATEHYSMVDGVPTKETVADPGKLGNEAGGSRGHSSVGGRDQSDKDAHESMQ